MLETVIGPIIIFVVATILMYLVREVTRIYGKLLDANNKNQPGPESAERILTFAVNEALKLQEERERGRKRRKSRVEDLTDEEIADKLMGKEEEEE